MILINSSSAENPPRLFKIIIEVDPIPKVHAESLDFIEIAGFKMRGTVSIVVVLV